MKIFDTHAHYCDPRFAEDIDELMSSLPSKGVCGVVNVGCCADTSERCLALAEKYDFCYASCGIHPQDVAAAKEGDLDRIRELLKHEKAVALGEIGLDYYYDMAPHDMQADYFRKQLEMALELDMPVIIHERSATADCLDIIRKYKGVRGVFHCYSGSWETAKELLSRGYMISFTGVVTFKNARRSVEVVRNMPLDRLMVETDAPYMAPEPLRGTRCDSSMIKYMIERIAEIRGMTPDEIGEITAENARRFFRIGK